MPFWYIGSLALLIAVAVRRRDGRMIAAAPLMVTSGRADGVGTGADQQPDGALDAVIAAPRDLPAVGPVALAPGSPGCWDVRLWPSGDLTRPVPRADAESQ